MRPGEIGYDELEAAAAARLEDLHTRPELHALMAAVAREIDPSERVPAQRVAVTAAKVVLRQSDRPLEEVAKEAGLALEDFKELNAGSPTARTQVALRVLDQIDAIYRGGNRTLGGTARLPVPDEVQRRLSGPANVLPSPIWLAAIVAILVAVVVLAVFR